MSVRDLHEVGPVPDTFEAILVDLLDVGSRLSALEWRETHRRGRHIAEGWYMRIERTAGVVLQLDREGFEQESAPLRRSIIEHVVGLKWLAAQGNDAVWAIRRGHASEARKRRDGIRAAGWTSPDYAVFDQVIDDLDRTEDHKTFDYLRRFEHRCDLIKCVDEKAGWLTDSPRCHATWESARAYLGADGVLLPKPKPTGRNTTAFVAMYMLGAITAIHDMKVDSPWEPEIRTLHERIRTLDNEVRRARGMPEV